MPSSTADDSLQQVEDNYVYVIIDLLILACCMRLFDYWYLMLPVLPSLDCINDFECTTIIQPEILIPLSINNSTWQTQVGGKALTLVTLMDRINDRIV